jgi:lipopolysaccharide export system permease protein
VRLFRIIDRYVFVEAVGLYMLGFTGFLAFLLINKLFLEADDILNPAMPGWAIVKITLLDAPYFANWSFPVAILFSTLMSMGRLAKDNELTAFFTNGISLYRLFIPFLFLSSASVLLAFSVQEYLVTKAASVQEALRKANPTLRDQDGEPDPFITRLDNGEFIAAKVFDKDQGRLVNVVYDDWMRENGTDLYVSMYGSVAGDFLQLGMRADNPAYVYDQMTPEGLYSGRTEEPVAQVNLHVDLKTQMTQMKTPQELTQTELAEQSKLKKQRGENPAEDLTDFHLKFSGPFASLAFALVAMPLSLRAPRDERLLGLVFCFILVLAYYTIFFVSKLMGYNGILPPWLAAWMMNIIFGFISFSIFVTSRK